MIKKLYIAVDNGVSGTIAALSADGTWSSICATPVRKQLNYAKTARKITRLDYEQMKVIIGDLRARAEHCVLLMEPPFTGANVHTALGAHRCYEAQLLAAEHHMLHPQHVAAVNWQKELLPHLPVKKRAKKGTVPPPPTETKGTSEKYSRSKILKEFSADVASRMFPQHAEFIKQHKDGDALLIAEFARRHNL